MAIRIKRIYEAPDSKDGYRVLVDRLWPRGMTKERAGLDSWLKDIAPSPKLRTWFGHDPDRFKEFSDLYVKELRRNSAVNELMELQRHHGTLTLLYAAKDPVVNHAAVLKAFLANSK